MSKARSGADSTCRYRVLLVEAAEVVRTGLAKIIGAASQFIVCAATGEYDDLDELLKRHRPHVLIAEPFGHDRDGIAWIKEIAPRFPKTKILVASAHAEGTYAERALRAGASGYWMKTGSAEELLRAIGTVLSGEIYVSPEITSSAVRRFVGREPDRAAGLGELSDRELQVFSLVAAGHGTGQIAQELGISRKTVETHCEHIKLKLGYRDAEALKRGAVEMLGPVNRPGRNP